MVGNVMIDPNTISVDNNVSFTLNWTEPFANFDPIVNYTIAINCTGAQCPVVFTVTTTSASVYFIADLSMMTPLSLTASNTINASNPTTIAIGGKLYANLSLFNLNAHTHVYILYIHILFLYDT